MKENAFRCGCSPAVQPRQSKDEEGGRIVLVGACQAHKETICGFVNSILVSSSHNTIDWHCYAALVASRLLISKNELVLPHSLLCNDTLPLNALDHKLFEPETPLSMREIISIFMECNVPHISSKRNPDINPDSCQELLDTFTRTVFKHRPPIDIGFRCMKLDLWDWAAKEIESMHSAQATLAQLWQQYMETLKASRSAERLYQLWRLNNENNYVVTRPSQRGENDAAAGLNPPLAEWWFIGQQTDDAQRVCRDALCKRTVSTCQALTAVSDLMDHMTIFADVVATVVEHHGGATGLECRKKKASLDVYRNLVESPLFTSLFHHFSSPQFFGWASFSTPTLSAKRDMAMQLFGFAVKALHETSVIPLLACFVTTAFASADDCIGPIEGLAARMMSGDPSLVLDVCAMDAFSSKHGAFGLARRSAGLLVQRCGCKPDLGALQSVLVSNIMDPQLKIGTQQRQLLEGEIKAAFRDAARSWGGHAVNTIVLAAHEDILMGGNAPNPDIVAWWSVVEQGIHRGLLETAWVTRLLQRRTHGTDIRCDDVCVQAERNYAMMFFPDGSPPSETHRVRRILEDMRTSDTLTTAVQGILEQDAEQIGNRLASVQIFSRVAAQDDLDKVTLPILPRCLQPTLDVVALTYNALSQPAKTVAWLPYRSHVTLQSSVSGREYQMSLAHLAVVEAVDDTSTPTHDCTRTVAGLAAHLGINPDTIAVLVDDLVEAGVLRYHGEHVLMEDTPPTAGSEAGPVDVVLISHKRVARLRRKQYERYRPALECALLKLFKQQTGPAVLPFDGTLLIAHLAHVMLPASMEINAQEVHLAVARLIDRQYLSLDAPSNMVSYVA